MQTIHFTIQKPIKLIDFLNHFSLSRANISKFIQEKSITINHQPADLNMILKKGDLFQLVTLFDEEDKFLPWKQEINIIHEDEDIIILNKPIQMLIHPDGNHHHTLSNALKYYYQNHQKCHDIRIVHRLDTDTSGIVIFAKHILSHSFLSKQMEEKLFQKTYIAVVSGSLTTKEGTIHSSIAKNRHENNRYIISSSGKLAITHYKVTHETKDTSTLFIQIETGRTHQIRVHLSSISHPILGDTFYGGVHYPRLLLHAKSISFIHPRKQTKYNIEIKLPKEFKDYV